MKEIWKPVQGTDARIEVSSYGRFKSNLRDGRILKATKDRKGYLRVAITLSGKKMHYKVHREVAKAFIANPDNLPQVNHIDGDKTNNRVNNLEWVTNAHNCRHAIETGLWSNVFLASSKVNKARMTPVYSVDISTGERRDFGSVSEAERFFNSRHISDVLNGKRNAAAGQRFYRR